MVGGPFMRDKDRRRVQSFRAPQLPGGVGGPSLLHGAGPSPNQRNLASRLSGGQDCHNPGCKGQAQSQVARASLL